MYLDELEADYRRQNSEETPNDIPVTGDIADDVSDLGFKIEHVN
jgi:hypothetical protein